MNEAAFLSQLTSAAIVIYGLEALKRWRVVQAVTHETRSLNRLLGVVGAGLAAAGVHFAFDSSAAQAGTYVITITGVTWSNLLHGAWNWISQWALQQLAYDGAVAKSAAAARGRTS